MSASTRHSWAPATMAVSMICVSEQRIVKGKKISDHVRFLVVPASREVYLQALDEGLIQIFMESGAIVMNPNCSVCWGSCQGVIGENEVLISTGTRNFKGRAGHPSSKVYLGSAATVAASAVKGEICTRCCRDHKHAPLQEHERHSACTVLILY